MKRIVLMTVVLVAFAVTADAQGFLKKLKQKAIDAVENSVERKVDRDVSREEADEIPAAEPEAPVKKEKSAQGEEQKSDFVPGSVVIFEDDLQGERMGEFPSKWDLISNNAEVARMNGKMAIKFEHGSDTEITPLLKDGNKRYLPEIYTLEFDFFGGDNCAYNLFFKPANDGDASRMWFGLDRMDWEIVKPAGGDWVQGSKEINDIVEKNDWNHFALSFNKRALKVYVNDKRIINIPNAKAMDWFTFKTEFWEDHVDLITNVRLAKGGVDLYDRNAQSMTAVEKAIAETGKFVTNNILFETGKATLKPESMEEIQKVSDYMKKNPTVRFEVQGHTDNQGSDAINDPLSQKRAEAVVKALASLGCDEFNLRAVGKGSHEPVADNKTEAGRAKNRRVEFIKK